MLRYGRDNVLMVHLSCSMTHELALLYLFRAHFLGDLTIPVFGALGNGICSALSWLAPYEWQHF